MSLALARALLLADAVTPDALAQALLASTTGGVSFVRALLSAGTVDSMRLEQVLERTDAPFMRQVSPVASLVEKLPPGLCERLLAVPVRRDPRTGTVDVAVVDAGDSHAVEEVAHWLRAPVRTVRTSFASMDGALRRLSEPEPGMRSLAPPIWIPASRKAPPPPGVEFPIPLKRRSGSPASRQLATPLVEPELAPSNVERELAPSNVEREPVLDLKRRKPSTAPHDAPVSSLPPRTERGPFSPATPFDDGALVPDEMRRASDRDRILELLVTGLRSVAGRVAVLAVRKDAFVGWTSSPEIGDRAAFRAVRISTSTRTLFSETLEHQGVLLARLPKDAAHAPLIAALAPPPPGEVALVGVHVEGKPVAVVVADRLGEALAATERMQELARLAGESLAHLLRDRRK
ncbi:MAG TPA: hypothetical protein VKU41_17565 [Polyangiaceae bacterium]|nr:hypothetical protein [Polyangiaceae bacterium]